MSRTRKLDKLVLLFLPVGVFVYMSTKPASRLKASMPAAFMDAPKGKPADAAAAEARVANAYWECAVTYIQFEYSYGAQLPDAVPNDFQIDSQEYGDGASFDVRARYWSRLRKLWLMPDAWRRDRGWSTAWATEPLAQFWDDVRAYLNHLVSG